MLNLVVAATLRPLFYCNHIHSHVWFPISPQRERQSIVHTGACCHHAVSRYAIINKVLCSGTKCFHSDCRQYQSYSSSGPLSVLTGTKLAFMPPTQCMQCNGDPILRLHPLPGPETINPFVPPTLVSFPALHSVIIICCCRNILLAVSGHWPTISLSSSLLLCTRFMLHF